MNSGICPEWQVHIRIFHCAKIPHGYYKQLNETFYCTFLGTLSWTQQPKPPHFNTGNNIILSADSTILFAS